MTMSQRVMRLWYIFTKNPQAEMQLAMLTPVPQGHTSACLALVYLRYISVMGAATVRIAVMKSTALVANHTMDPTPAPV